MSVTDPTRGADVVEALLLAWATEALRTFHPDGAVTVTHTPTGAAVTVRDVTESGRVSVDGGEPLKAEVAREVALEALRYRAGEEPDNGCLTGLRCPACGNRERLRISVGTFAVMDPDGADDLDGDLEWDDGSVVACPRCEHRDFLRAFTRGQAPMTDAELRLEFRAAATAADLLRAASLLAAERGADAPSAFARLVPTH